MKNKIRNIVENNITATGKFFDLFIQFIIIVSLISFSFETLPNNSERITLILNIIEQISIVIFSIEYIVRIWISEKSLKYIFSFYGIIDLLAIMPFYLRLTIDLRFLRAFRILRIFRSLKFIRYNKAFNRFNIAFKIIKEEIILFSIVTAILIFISASGIYFFENEAQPELFCSVFHSIWWAIVTLTTVGYGDVYPITLGGRIFTFFVLIIGVGIVTIPAGLVASALSKARKIEDEKINNEVNDEI